MEKNSTVTSLGVLHEIERRVIEDEQSPFKTMLSKAKDIDIDYFERINRSRGVNRLSEQLNLGVKDQVLEAFGKMADGYYVDGDLLEQLKALAFQKAEDSKDKKEFLKTLAGLLAQCADKGVPSAGWSRYSEMICWRNTKTQKRLR